MPSKKRIWNATTPIRYQNKIYTIIKSRGVPEHEALKHAILQTTAWELGSGMYRDVRKATKRLLDQYGIPPTFRAGFYAVAQWLAKEKVMGGTPDRALYDFGMEKFGIKYLGNVGIEIYNKICDMLGINRYEVRAETKPKPAPKGASEVQK